MELRSIRCGQLNFNDPAAGGRERVWDYKDGYGHVSLYKKTRMTKKIHLSFSFMLSGT